MPTTADYYRRELLWSDCLDEYDLDILVVHVSPVVPSPLDAALRLIESDSGSIRIEDPDLRRRIELAQAAGPQPIRDVKAWAMQLASDAAKMTD